MIVCYIFAVADSDLELKGLGVGGLLAPPVFLLFAIKNTLVNEQFNVLIDLSSGDININ